MVGARHLADAMDGRGDARHGMENPLMPEIGDTKWSRFSSDPIKHASLQNHLWLKGSIVDLPKRKILCSCGVIAEIDSRMVGVKSRLGKSLECRRCRNERIAREREELEKHFLGEEREDEGHNPF
ncbi:MAG: hypothetical protein QW520_02575 [Methanomassiliicoccales archaeon]